MRFRSSNLVFKKILNSSVDGTYEVATYGGITRKTLFFLLMVLVGAFGGIYLGINYANTFSILITVSALTTFIFALLAMLIPSTTKIFGTLYCLAEGMLVGVISFVFEAVADGAVTIALLSTILVFVIVVTLFLTKAIKVTSKFKRFLIAFAISFIVAQLLFYVISLLFNGFVYSFEISLLVSGVSVFLATLYLLFDLDNIRMVVEGGYPKELEWSASFGLVFTLIWLYIEILRIVALIFSNRN